MIGLTETAAVKVIELIENRPNPTQGLRSAYVGVDAQVCLFLEFAEAANKGDRELESHGVTLFVDPKSYLYLMGTEVDYVDSLGGSGFKFTNPNARRTCGCGESFSV